jgi:hypothetical protein
MTITIKSFITAIFGLLLILTTFLANSNISASAQKVTNKKPSKSELKGKNKVYIQNIYNLTNSCNSTTSKTSQEQIKFYLIKKQRCVKSGESVSRADRRAMLISTSNYTKLKLLNDPKGGNFLIEGDKIFRTL